MFILTNLTISLINAIINIIKKLKWNLSILRQVNILNFMLKIMINTLNSKLAII